MSNLATSAVTPLIVAARRLDRAIVNSGPRRPSDDEEMGQFYAALQHRWSLWRRPEQWVSDDDDWSCWVFLAGRGTGKTRSGAEKICEWAANGTYNRVHLIAPTAGDVRDTMVEGPAGILACSPPDNMPRYEPSKRKLTWRSGMVALLFSADKPDRLRGPQCQALWADEPCAWRHPEAWDMAMFGLRLQPRPRSIVTTTPRPTRLIKEILAGDNVHITRGTTYDNRANLADSFFASIIARYEGTRLGRQELLGELLTDNPQALWKRTWIDDARVTQHPELTRIVVAVDPAISATAESNETGIIVAGRDKQKVPHFYTLDDCTVEHATPQKWGTAAVTAYYKWRADLIVAEKNQGGDMVEATIHNVDPSVPVKLVSASRGKRPRAEPISALAEQGRDHHVGVFPQLEDQLCEWEPDHGMDSPDRLDAKVWALTELDDSGPVTIRASRV